MTDPPKNPKTKNEITSLRRAVKELTLLNELARAIGSTSDLDEIIPMIVSRATGAIAAEQVVLTLVDPSEMSPAGTLFRQVNSAESDHFHLTRNLLGCMCHERRALMINDVATDSRLKGIPLDPGIRNLLCVPLMVGSELIGVLSAYNKIGGKEFQSDDQRLLAIMASQSAQILDRARLLKEEEANAQLKADLLVAERIQTSLLPTTAPSISGYDVAGISVPARQIGGDYFDFIPLSEDHWGIVLGDVSGKGVPAALLMANLQAMLRGQAPKEARPRQFIQWCNNQLFLSTPLDKFATLFYGILDLGTHNFTYCNAGHERPFLFCGQEQPQRLHTGGLAVGIIAAAEYQEETVSLQPGDMLVVFSDGVTDMLNHDDEPFGEERLLDILEQAQDQPAARLIDLVQAALRDHAAEMPPFDDVTLVVVKRT